MGEKNTGNWSGCLWCAGIGLFAFLCFMVIGGIMEFADRRRPASPPIQVDKEEIRQRREAAAERAREEVAETRQRAREEFGAAGRRTPRQVAAQDLEEAREVLAWRQTIFDYCAQRISTATPIGEQRSCFDEGRFLYYCWLGPAESYCEREYDAKACRGCGLSEQLQARVSGTLRDLGWSGAFAGPRFRAVR